MRPTDPSAPLSRARTDLADGARPPPLATVLQVSERLRRVFGSPGYKPPMLPSVAMEIHELSCRPDIEINRLIDVLERDPMLAGHILKVANSPIFRGRDPETSLRSALLRLGLKNLGEIVFELALHMRVFRSAEYSGVMEQLRRHSTACANLCRLVATGAGQDPENAFLCGLLHDIGIAAILIVLSEKRKSEPELEASVLDEVVRQTHEDVSGMLARLWKLPVEVVDVVARHHGQAAVDSAPLLSSVVVLADTMTTKFKFSVDFGVGVSDGSDAEAFAAACTKLRLGEDVVARLEEEARKVLKRVDETLKHKRSVVDETAPPPQEEELPSKTRAAPRLSQARPAAVPASARKKRIGVLARAWRAVLRAFR